MERLKNIILYAGLDKEKNLKYRDLVLTQDVSNLTKYLSFAGIMYLVLGIASAASSGFAQRNTRIYFVTALSFGIVFLLSLLTQRRRGKAAGLNRLYIYLFMLVLYAEAIVLTILHPDQPAVTYIAILLILPLLFAQYPLPMILFQGCMVVVFCILASCFKNPETASIDVWNGITFYIVSAIEIVLIIPMRFNQVIQPEIIRELSETDLLTGLKNRNAFELYCSELCRKEPDVACIYADANGLHELNNAYGHEAGDRMLKAVAGVLREQFEADTVFRIGGDEFVAFSSDTDGERIEGRLLAARNALKQMGYHLSVGCAGPDGSCTDIHALIKQAESRMYADKRAYYSSAENNRRSR